jgi:hypothetical protein
MNNVRAGKPAGPMKDKEVVSHPASKQTQTKTSSSHEDHGHH